MRTFYAEYVQHCLRFFARHPEPTFRNNADKLNWEACNKAIKNFPDDKDMLLEVYQRRDTLSDNVYEVSVKYKVKQDIIWNLLLKLEKQVALNRGLIE